MALGSVGKEKSSQAYPFLSAADLLPKVPNTMCAAAKAAGGAQLWDSLSFGHVVIPGLEGAS